MHFSHVRSKAAGRSAHHGPKWKAYLDAPFKRSLLVSLYPPGHSTHTYLDHPTTQLLVDCNSFDDVERLPGEYPKLFVQYGRSLFWTFLLADGVYPGLLINFISNVQVPATAADVPSVTWTVVADLLREAVKEGSIPDEYLATLLRAAQTHYQFAAELEE